VYWAGRLTLCANADELDRYDTVFDAYFGDRPGQVVRRQRLSRSQLQLVASPDDPGDGEQVGDEPQRASAAASSVEQLRHRDVTAMTSAEKEQLRALLAAMRLPGERRPTRRLRPAHRGTVDGGRTLRAWLAAGGEPARLRHRAPSSRHRRVVLLVDVSGSMDGYADALLRFAHAASRSGSAPTEVLRAGHPADPADPRAGPARPGHRHGGVAARCPTPVAAPGWASWSSSSSTSGASAAPRAGPSSSCCPTAGSAATRRCSAPRWPGCTGSRTGSCGATRARRPGIRPAGAGMAAAPAARDDFVEGHSLAALERLAEVVVGRSLGSLRGGRAVRDIADGLRTC
jgi:hypothetical protein